jgi:hypothetical protein
MLIHASIKMTCRRWRDSELIALGRHVDVYRFVSKDTMEEDVLERAKKKLVLEYASTICSHHDRIIVSGD